MRCLACGAVAHPCATRRTEDRARLPQAPSFVTWLLGSIAMRNRAGRLVEDSSSDRGSPASAAPRRPYQRSCRRCRERRDHPPQGPASLPGAFQPDGPRSLGRPLERHPPAALALLPLRRPGFQPPQRHKRCFLPVPRQSVPPRPRPFVARWNAWKWRASGVVAVWRSSPRGLGGGRWCMTALANSVFLQPRVPGV